jgi:hypothetical protein
MDETSPFLPLSEDPAELPVAPWPTLAMRPSAKLLDSEAWFSEERCGSRALSGTAGGDLP